MLEKNKIKHFYLNKYFIKPFSIKKYFLSYNYQYNLIWFRVAKAASRTIDLHLRENSLEENYIYGSEVGYLPSCYSNFVKFAFVRNPVDRFLSSWKNKVIDQNYFKFSNNEHAQMQKLENFIVWVESQDINNCDEHIRSQNSLIDITNLDFLGRVESFNEDFKKLASLVNMPVKEVYKKNSSRSSKMDEIDPKLVDKIKSIYEMDVRIFYPHI